HAIGAGAGALEHGGDGCVQVGEREVLQPVVVASAHRASVALRAEIDAPHLEAGLAEVALQREAAGVVAEDERVHPVAGHDQHRPPAWDEALLVPGLEQREEPAVAVGDRVLEGLHYWMVTVLVTVTG